MKTISKKVLSIILCMVMLMSTFVMGITASAANVKSGTCGENLTWTLDDEGTLTISGTGDMANYLYYYGESPWCDSQTSVKTVIIESGVTSIGNYAFYNCRSLTSITIPEGVTSIGKYAFYICSNLESITIPDSVTSIGESAFANCTSLKSITIPDSVTSIGESAFSSCSSLTLIIVDKDNTIYDSRNNCNAIIETATNSLISGCKSTIIPDGVTSIGDCAFYGCSSLTSITIPEGVTSIGSSAFKSCTILKNITIPDSVTSIGGSAFSGCSSLTSITIPEGVTSIGDDAFRVCSSLTSITIPEGVTSIGNYAFYYCSSLKSITIPDGVTRIGEYAFYECTNLTSITIPDSVTSIGDYAFSSSRLVVFCNKDSYTHTYCKTNSIDYVLLDDDADRYITGSLGTKLTWSIDKLQRTLKINCNGNMPSFSSNDAPWKEYSKYFITATIEDGCTSIGENAFSGCSSLTSITIPKGVTIIGDDAFLRCSSLESITIPDSVTSIGYYAFSGCSSLTSIIIPDGVISISSDAFYNCKSLESITISDSVTSIGSSAFSNCKSLVSITISDSVTSIGSSAFYECSSLTEIEIPYSVKTIGSSTFSNCSALDKIYIYNRNCSISDTSAIPYNATIYGFTGSTAETFADENGYYFVAIDDTHEHVYKNDCDSKCNLCGATRTVTHAYELTTSKAPTCTAKGSETYVCSICSDSYTSPVAALGHTYGTYTSNGDATCTKDGTKTAVCTVCEAKNTITDKGSKLPHTDANKDGYCDVCNTLTDADLANPCRNAKINVASAKSVDYKAQVTIKATANGVPAGYSLAMYVNGKQVAKGSNTEVTYTVGQATSDINYTVKVIDAKGNVQKDATNKDLAKEGGKITVNSSFFAKIIAFFKSLFGSLSKVEVKP